MAGLASSAVPTGINRRAGACLVVSPSNGRRAATRLETTTRPNSGWPPSIATGRPRLRHRSPDETELVPPRSRSTSVVRPRFGPKGSRLTQPSRVVGARGTSPDHAPAVPAGSGRALPTPLSRATKIRPGYPRPEGRRRIQAPSEPSGPPKSSFNSLPNGRGRGFTPRSVVEMMLLDPHRGIKPLPPTSAIFCGRGSPPICLSRGRGFTPRWGAPDALSLPPGTFATVLAIVFEMTADRADGRG